jgi:hypothetical protein
MTCCRAPRWTHSRQFCPSPRPQSFNRNKNLRGRTLPPRAASLLISLIHYFPIQSSRDFGFRLHHWRTEELLRTVAVPQTDATVGHSYLQLSIAPVAQRTAEAWRRRAEDLEGSPRFTHRIARPLLSMSSAWQPQLGLASTSLQPSSQSASSASSGLWYLCSYQKFMCSVSS